MTELGTLDDCSECSGPPPIFRLPPPPRPPFLTEGTFCSEAPLAELEDCGTIPLIDVPYQNNPSLQNTTLIITCAIVLLLTTTIVFVVFWKFFARSCLNTFGLSHIWQCFPICCQMSSEGPAASLIHAQLKEPNESSRRVFSNQHSNTHHQYHHYAIQHSDSLARGNNHHLHPAIPLERERIHNNHDCEPVSHITDREDVISQTKSPRRSSGGTEHVIMLLSVAAQLTHKKPRFL